MSGKREAHEDQKPGRDLQGVRKPRGTRQTGPETYIEEPLKWVRKPGRTPGKNPVRTPSRDQETGSLKGGQRGTTSRGPSRNRTIQQPSETGTSSSPPFFNQETRTPDLRKPIDTRTEANLHTESRLQILELLEIVEKPKPATETQEPRAYLQ